MEDRELLLKAQAARKHAYAPYSNFAVGAALLTGSGAVYAGCNVENSSFGLTCCAERIALFKAVSEGEREFEKLAIAGPEGREVLPCGACLQVFAEFSSDLRVLTCEKGTVKSYTLKELLPRGFRLS